MKSALFVGRFQPFHNGHLSVVQMILEKFERVIMVIGSAEENLTEENPWTAGERISMIEASMKAAGISAEKYLIVPVRNIHNYALWVDHLRQYVPPFECVYTGSELVRKCFERAGVEVVWVERVMPISGTMVREKLSLGEDVSEFVNYKLES